jgi:3-oxoacyl-[acyl-carrier protein] reductase
MPAEWRNQVAVVTGGARGIGRATALLLAQHCAAVCVNYAVQSDAG